MAKYFLKLLQNNYLIYSNTFFVYAFPRLLAPLQIYPFYAEKYGRFRPLRTFCIVL